MCIAVLFSCKAKKKLVAVTKTDTVGAAVKPPLVATDIIPGKSAAEMLKANKLRDIRARQVDFNTFSGKAQAKLNINGDKHDVTLNIRIKKNKQIWISITALLGVEAARALITPDSIKVMNKLQGTYLKKPFSYVYSYASKQINYKTLESLLIGNAIPELISDNATLKPDNGNVILSGLLQDLAYKLTVGPGLKVTQTSMSNQIMQQSLQVDNSVLIQAGTRVMPSQININSSVKQKTIQADIRYTRADFDQPVDMPFSVPARYEVIR
jgi:hypothetical protein